MLEDGHSQRDTARTVDVPLSTVQWIILTYVDKEQADPGVRLEDRYLINTMLRNRFLTGTAMRYEFLRLEGSSHCA